LGVARVTLAEFKAIAREQFFMLLLEPEAAVEAIPKMLPDDPALRQRVFDFLRQVLSATGDIEPEVMERLRQLGRLCDVDVDAPRVANLPVAAKAEQAKAS